MRRPCPSPAGRFASGGRECRRARSSVCAPGRIDHGEARHAGDQPEILELDQGLAESARIAEIAAGNDDPVGHLPAQALEDAKDDGLLAFEPEGIDRVHQVDAEAVGDLPHALHRVVEIADDLDRQRTVVERLRQLAVSDLARYR